MALVIGTCAIMLLLLGTRSPAPLPLPPPSSFVQVLLPLPIHDEEKEVGTSWIKEPPPTTEPYTSSSSPQFLDDESETLLKTLDVCSLAKRNRVEFASVHAELAQLCEHSALEYSCSSIQRTFARTTKPTPYTWLGWKLVANYLLNRNWVEQPRLRHDSNLLVASCHQKLVLEETRPHFNAISVVPHLQEFVARRNFFEVVRDRSYFLRCDYKKFHPEAYYVRSRDNCLTTQRTLDNNVEKYRNATWITKEGQIITTKQFRDAMPRVCELVVYSIFMQRELENVLVANVEMYLLISNYFPNPSAWFFMGHFDSERMVFDDLELDAEQRAKLKHNLKQAVLQTFHIAFSKLQTRERAAFSLFGVHITVHNDLTVKVMGVDCDPELTSTPTRVAGGEKIVALEQAMVRGMMDIVLVSNLHADSFADTLNQFITEHDQELMADSEDNDHWELLYSENPRFDYTTEVC